MPTITHGLFLIATFGVQQKAIHLSNCTLICSIMRFVNFLKKIIVYQNLLRNLNIYQYTKMFFFKNLRP